LLAAFQVADHANLVSGFGNNLPIGFETAEIPVCCSSKRFAVVVVVPYGGHQLIKLT